jgi:hypothetical protein
MKIVLKLSATIVAFVGLSACDMLGLNKGGSGNGSATGNAATANGAAPANVAATAGTGGKPTDGAASPASAPFSGQVNSAFLVGRWTDTNDCTSTIEFLSDGSFSLPDGRGGVWALDGDRLTFQGASTVSARVQAPNANTITLLHDDGTLGRSTRCPG